MQKKIRVLPVGFIFSLLSILLIPNVWSTEEENPEEKEEKTVVAVVHSETTPSILKKQDESETNFFQQPAQKYKEKTENDLDLTCYRNGLCLAREKRTVKLKKGTNTVVLENLLDGVMPETLNFISPENKKISVLNYEFQKNEISRKNLIAQSLGKDVSFNISDQSEEKTGKLIGISRENNEFFAIIEKDKKFFVPIDRCVGFENSSPAENIWTNRVRLTLDSSDEGDAKLEMSYVTSGIVWKHFCIVDISESLSSIDVFSNAALINNTNRDLEEVDVIFDTFSPSIAGTAFGSDPFSSRSGDNSTYANTISVAKNSKVISMLSGSKGVQPKREYIARIPAQLFKNSFANKVDIKSKNLLVVENSQNLGLSANFQNSEMFLFSLKNGARDFLSHQKISAFARNNEFIFELGNSSDIITVVSQTDYRKISENQFDWGICVSLRNNTKNEAPVTIVLDAGFAKDVTKSNIEMQKSGNGRPMWKIKLAPLEQKELHFRIKMSKPMELVTFPDKRLAKKCTEVAIGDAEIGAILEEMSKKVIEWEGIGLAGPQVGVLQRVVVLYDPRQPETMYKMINPKIVWKSDNMVESQEGCLSLPGMSATVSRHEMVTVEYLDETFTKKTLEADGILAICIQHETDHLDGKLYIDRLPAKERADFVKNFNKLRESFEQQAQ